MADIAFASGDLSLAPGVGVELGVMAYGCRAAHIELENPGNHNDGLWTISILKHCELEGFRAVDKKSAAAALFFLDHPISVAVLTDQEVRRFCKR
jgi:hypothetical protein